MIEDVASRDQNRVMNYHIQPEGIASLKANIAKSLKSIDLEQLESLALYLLIFIFFVFQIADIAGLNPLPGIDLARLGALLNSAYLVMIFRVQTRQIDDLRLEFIHDADVGLSFNHQVSELIKKKPILETLDILTNDTTNFYHVLVDLQFHADQIKNLLHSKTPGIDEIIEKWVDLKTDGKICNELIIKTYELSPVLNVIIMDRSDGCFGFFYPKYVANPILNPKRRSTGPYVLTHRDPMGVKKLQDMSLWFEQASEFSSRLVYSSAVL